MTLSPYTYAVVAMLYTPHRGGGGYSSTLFNATKAHQDAGILFVAAAGNSAWNMDVQPDYPATYNLDNIISVGSITSTGAISSFSNYRATTVDLMAPGSSIYSTWSGSGYTTISGTSEPLIARALAWGSTMLQHSS